MRSCIYPGSFDPVTKGHLDIIERTAALFDKVHVAVLNNSQKKYMFDIGEREAMLTRVCADFDNVDVCTSGGLLVGLMEQLDTRTIIRGLRSNADLELEQQLAAVNGQLLEGVETVILLSRPEMIYVSSGLVKELISYGADVSGYVPGSILDIIHGRNS